MADKVVIYQDSAGEFRWRRKDARNGQTVSDSGEGYSRLHDAKRAALEVNPGLTIEVEPDDGCE